LGERRYSSYSFLNFVLDGVSGQRNASVTLYPQGKDPRYSLDRRLGGAFFYKIPALQCRIKVQIDFLRGKFKSQTRLYISA
jgi:hypothetical protein